MKKIVNLLLAAMLSISVVLPTVSCKEKECTHNVGTWDILTAATCETEGIRSGICGICYKTVEEVIPSNPVAHVYGDWVIGTMPTETAEGVATKTCSMNGVHVLTATLPVLGDTKYDSEITKRPTPTEDGERTYEMKHEEGKITFTQVVPASGIQLVRDAVDLGVANESKAQIRSATGSMSLKHYNTGASTPHLSTTSKQSYEFGENYTYLVDGTDNCQRWYFTDEEGTVYGLTDRNGGGKIINDLDDPTNKNYMNGSRFYLQYANDLGIYYGVESFLEGLYRAARWSDNDDFTESMETVEDKKVYSFSFGHVQNSGKDSGYFAKVSVSFTLTESFSVESLLAQAIVYVNNYQQTDGTKIESWELDENGNAKVIDGMEEKADRYISTVEMAQTKKAEGDKILVNEHTFEKMYVQDFDLTYYDEVLKEGDKAQFASGKVTDYIFGISGVTPESALNDYGFDNFSFYLRTQENGQTVDKPIDALSMTTVGMAVFVNSDRKFFLNAQQSGSQQVVVKTKYVEKVIDCEIGAALPSAIYPAIYEYSQGSYHWERLVESEQTSVEKTVYTHQPFYFTIDVPKTEINYAFSTYKVTKVLKDGVLLTENELNMGEYFLSTAVSNKNTPVTQFSAKEGGKYEITLSSMDDKGNIYSSVQSVITVNVLAAPTMEVLAGKTYSANMQVPNVAGSGYEISTVTVTFKDGAWSADGTTWTGTAVVDIKSAKEELTCTYVLADRMLTSEHLGGMDMGFSMAINEAYDFVLSVYIDAYDGINSEEVLLADSE